MKENIIQIKSAIMMNLYASLKKHHICEKYFICNSATRSYENGKYLTNMTDSVVTYDEIIEETKNFLKHFNE